MRLLFHRMRSLPALVALAACVACGSDSTGPGTRPPDPVWTSIENLVPQTTLYALWTPREDLVVGVGSDGQIWQWDGFRWLPRTSQTGEDLFAITGDPLGTVVAVGDAGTALEQVGGSFTPRITGTQEDLRGLWLSESGTFIAVGTHGTILRGPGSSWSGDPSPTIASLFSVWGSGDSDVFAVGVGGTILHYNGATWSPMQSGTTEILSSVSGTGANDVYAVGAAGTILHFDGNSWSPMTSHTDNLLQSVCADCGPRAAGTNGTVLRLESGVWTKENLQTPGWLYAIAQAGPDIWAVGAHTLYRNTAGGWAAATGGTVPVLRSITHSPTEQLVTVGDGGAVMLGGLDHWRFEDAGALSRLNAVFTTPSNDILAAGNNHIYRYTPGGWVSENEEIIEYFDIDGNDQQIFAVGSGGTIRERHGTTWSFVASPTGENLNAITMTENGGYIVGGRGNILHLESFGWDLKFEWPGVVLWDVMPVDTGPWRAVAVGAGGVTVALPREPGSPWTQLSSPVNSTLYSMARGPGDVIYAVGVNGVVVQFVGNEWRTAPSPASRTLLHAYSHDDQLFVCGGSTAGGGFLFRYATPGP